MGNIAEKDTGSTTRLKKASIPKLLNRFASVLARKLNMELLKLVDLIGAEGWGLPGMIKVEGQRLLVVRLGMNVLTDSTYLTQKTAHSFI